MLVWPLQGSSEYWTATMLAFLLCNSSVAADTLVDRNGRGLSGRLDLEVLVLETAERTLEVPRSSIRSIRSQAGALEVRLVDGHVITGVPFDPQVAIDLGLFAERFLWEEIATVELEASPAEVIEEDRFLRVDDFPVPREAVEKNGLLRLELDVELIRELLSQKRATPFTSGKLRSYYCEDVSIPYLQLLQVERSGVPEFTWEFHILVRPSFDRRVDLRLELLDGSMSLWQHQERGIDAEEGKVRRIRLGMSLGRSRIERVLAEDASLRLRLTLAVSEG